MIKIWVMMTLVLQASAAATNLIPWYPRNLEFQWLSAFSYQHYRYIDVAGHSSGSSGHRSLYLQSLSLAYSEWCGELELFFADSSFRRFGGDSVKGTLRYQFMDDITGDAASVVVGGSCAAVFAPALRDIAMFHSSALEGELHFAIGKELSTWSSWSSRGWLVAAVGVGDHGSPWLFGKAAVEKNICERHFIRLETTARRGLGGKAPDLASRFHGYGSIDYSALAAAVSYCYCFDCGSELILEYEKRYYARNCPGDAEQLLFVYIYPFGL